MSTTTVTSSTGYWPGSAVTVGATAAQLEPGSPVAVTPRFIGREPGACYICDREGTVLCSSGVKVCGRCFLQMRRIRP
jgi:hypothetical protein